MKGERNNGPAVEVVEKANVRNPCSQTIRRLDCEVIIDQSCFHCDNCRLFRNLRSALSRKRQIVMRIHQLVVVLNIPL